MNAWLKKNWWLIVVIVCVIAIAFMVGCSAPPYDANKDGIVDETFKEWVAEKGDVANSVTGGLFSSWIDVLEKATLAALGIYAYITKKSIAQTDKNVDTVAKAANVPDEKMV